MVTSLNNAGAIGSPATLDADRRQIFQKAQRHSRRVSILKYALPIIGVALTAGFAFYSYSVTPPASVIKADQSAVAKDGKLVMAAPKMEGFTKDNRPYSMTAERAFQDLTQMGLIELEKLSASLPYTGEATASLSAEKGFYNRDKNTLELKDGLSVKTSDGMAAKLESAFVNVAEGSITSNAPVAIELNGAKVQADQMQVKERGKILVFDKGVKLVLEPSRLQKKSTESGS